MSDKIEHNDNNNEINIPDTNHHSLLEKIQNLFRPSLPPGEQQIHSTGLSLNTLSFWGKIRGLLIQNAEKVTHTIRNILPKRQTNSSIVTLQAEVIGQKAPSTPTIPEPPTQNIIIPPTQPRSTNPPAVTTIDASAASAHTLTQPSSQLPVVELLHVNPTLKKTKPEQPQHDRD